MQEPSASGLTPAQERTLALLRKPDQVTIFDADFIAELKHEAEAAMVSLSARLEGESLWISKSFLARVHGCEAFHLAPDDFEWSPASATGFVSHKAIELALNWRGDPVPAVVVDEALARLEDQADGRGAFIAGLCEADRAELVAALRGVSYVVLFSDPNVERLLLLLKPDVHCKGTDYTVETVPERAVVVSYGGRTAIVGDPKNHNTRELIAKIAARTA